MNPAEQLLGQTVAGDWLVEEPINLAARGATGGNFCIAYKVRNVKTNQRAFLKVLDLIGTMQRYSDRGVSIAETLSRVATAHVFETKLLEECKTRNLDRIVHALASGEIAIPVPIFGTLRFPFLIFELGDGDTHTIMKAGLALDYAWWLSTLHQAAIGLGQLHGIEVSHQDLKPSNLVFFGVDNAKLADLGRATRKGSGSLNDSKAGDAAHAPPEYFYNYVPAEWGERFLALDLYLLGSLAFIGVTGLSMTTALFHTVEPAFHFLNYKSGTYKNALPALEKALADILEQVKTAVPDSWREPFIQSIAQLCQPDPAKRGHPENHRVAFGERYSLERYISAFNRMALMARADLR